MTTNEHSPLFKLAAKFLKYFLLAFLGFAIAYVLSIGLGASNFAAALLPFVGSWFGKLGIVLLCFMAIVMIIESWR